MIRRSVKFQLVAFAVISLLGIFYVGSNYVGIHFLSAGPYKVTLVVPQTGGIFTNAEVTERGVTVGRVGSVAIPKDPKVCAPAPNCVTVQLAIDHGKRIPTDLKATVANLSAVGEQYVDLEPQTDSTAGPFLRDGSVIAADRTTLPLDDATFLLNIDKLVNSVNRKHLATVINQLGKGFQGLGPSLQSLIDNGNLLTQAAIDSLPQQLALIDDSKTVLDTQNQVAGELKAWARSMASFSDQLRVSDPDLRSVLDNGVKASRQVASLLRANANALPDLLGNLITVNRIQAVRLPYVRATLELFPGQAAGGFYVTPGDGTAHFGMVADSSNPCATGYSSTKLRGNNDNGSTPSDWGGPANLNAYCHGKGIKTDYRGSRKVPRPDHAQVNNSDPYPGPTYGKSNHPTVNQQNPSTTSLTGALTQPSSGSGQPTVSVPYDPTTGLFTAPGGKQYRLGYSGPLAPIFGSSSWEWLLVAPTMR